MLTALVGIPIVALIVWWRDGALVFPVALALAMISLHELATATRNTETPIIETIAYPALLALMLAPKIAYWYNRDTVIIFVRWIPWLLTVAALIWAVLHYPLRRRISLLSVALTVLATLYVSLFLALVFVRSHPAGHALMWLTLLGVWAGDIAAYYTGRAVGRQKLTPLSPGKTREGVQASIVATIITCTIVAVVGNLGWTHGILLGIIIGILAPLGDLAESFWKRELGVKDLGRLLPGHGGVLDRCDSLLFAAFATYVYTLWRL
ncbi:MAG: phosphatidate cytidylyltransferase [Armatimonadota bacterium]|nr:phosphatidate cytidylyltransferase [Armatimonadota bacterium]